MKYDPAVISKMMMQGFVSNTRPLEEMIFVRGKVALVTGGTSGLGFCVAQRLLQGGAKVVVSSHSEAEAETAMGLFAQAGYKDVTFFKANVCSEADVEALVKFTAETYGTLDILVTCAGVWSYAHVYDMPEEEFNRVMDVNLGGVFRAAKHVSRYMIDNKVKGKIVFVSSNVYTMPYPPFGGYPHYAASKGGIISMTVEIARELKRYGIMVNTVAPGAMATPGGMTQGILRTLPPEKQAELAAERAISKMDQSPNTDDVAIAVYMMCTHAADGITGECLVCDYGMAHGIISRQPAIQEYPPSDPG